VQLGAILPQTEIGPDPTGVARFALAAEESGYSYLMAYDHVLGADRRTRPDWSGAYSHEDQFHEPMVLYGWLAAKTSLELVTGVLVLPQRQTALVAKQAAEIDILTGGKFRLGVGVGWNEVEYLALNEDFHNRGRRYEEQIEVLRLLWTRDIVDFEGRFHRIDRAGILPRPVQQPIPVWMGSRAGEVVLRRVGRLGDGWIANLRVGQGFEEGLAVVRDAADRAGRTVGVQATIAHTTGLDEMRRQRDVLRQLGVDYCSVSTLGAGLTPTAHADTIADLAGQLRAD
jgi:probable F420-dependent oxidoreductase